MLLQGELCYLGVSMLNFEEKSANTKIYVINWSLPIELVAVVAIALKYFVVEKRSERKHEFKKSRTFYSSTSKLTLLLYG